jgi:hypothetical protein
MNNIFRGLIAGYGAKKLGGGCFGTIVVFIIIWVALGQCSWTSEATPAPETYPADRRVYVPGNADGLNASTKDYFVISAIAVHPAIVDVLPHGTIAKCA